MKGVSSFVIVVIIFIIIFVCLATVGMLNMASVSQKLYNFCNNDNMTHEMTYGFNPADYCCSNMECKEIIQCGDSYCFIDNGERNEL